MAPQRRQASVFPYRGKWRVQYLDSFGRQRTLTAESRQAGYLKLAEIEGQIRGGFLNPTATSIPSFGQWLDYWLSARKPELNPTTWHGYESSCRNWIKPVMGHLRLDTVTPRQIQDLYSFLSQEHHLAAGTIRRLHSLFSSAFNLALQQGIIHRTPMLGVRQPKLERKAIEVFTRGEVETILKTAANKPPAAHLRWLLALKYGMRQGEVLGLKFTDFDPSKRTLRIQRTVNSLPGQGVVELPTKSKNATRTIPIDDQVFMLVSQLHAGEWLFESSAGGPLDASLDGSRWRALLEEAGVRHLPLHSARHTVATHLMQSGVNPRVVQMLLGHSSPAYTLATYVHPQLSEIAIALDAQPQLAVGR